MRFLLVATVLVGLSDADLYDEVPACEFDPNGKRLASKQQSETECELDRWSTRQCVGSCTNTTGELA